MKPRYVACTCALLLCIILNGTSFAIENNIGGNAKIAGMGFSQVAGNLGVLANPASFDCSKVAFSFSRSELYDIGIVYNYLEGTIRLLPSWRVGLSYETVEDQDQIDYSGYEQQLFILGISYKVNDRLKLGVNMRHNQFNLFKENIGDGFSCDFGMLIGPFEANKTDVNFGLKVENIFGERKYKTDRVESAEPVITLGSNIDIGNISCAFDIKQDALRFGIEYQVVSSLKLRAGLDNGQPTLGIGVLRGPLQIDYGYWLSEVGATHRVGSSISF